MNGTGFSPGPEGVLVTAQAYSQKAQELAVIAADQCIYGVSHTASFAYRDLGRH
jgi:hypothetical protein